MTVLFHPEFPRTVRRYSATYDQISSALALRFCQEVDVAILAVKQSPASAGHFVNLGSKTETAIRRRNLRAFPFFLLYGLSGERLIFGAIIPSHSDPLTWLAPFRKPLT